MYLILVLAIPYWYN